MELTDYILKNYKMDPGVVEVNSIRSNSTDVVCIDYIVFDENNNSKYISKTTYAGKNEIIPLIRAYNLDMILEKSPGKQGLMIDENILDESSKKIVEGSRVGQYLNIWDRISNLRMDYAKNFRIGQRVKYKGQDSIITFLHEGFDDNGMTRWSIDTKGVETRYISGLLLVNNPKKKMWDNIKPSVRILNMSTKRLLDEMKFTRFKNKKVFMEAKYVLSTREHVVRPKK